VAADELLDGTPAVREIVRRFVGDPDLANLPRKFKTAVTGSPHQDVAHEVHDVAFVGVDHPEHGPGFDVWVGGGLVDVADAGAAARGVGAAGGRHRGVVRRVRGVPRLRVPAACAAGRG
jgi:sulfite reductase beta subunit-like hemoprotein